MRYSRQNKILELIQQYEIDTQEKLAALLKENGFQVTQATVSRDIKELQLIKALMPSGQYKYTVAISESHPITDRFVKIFRETITSIAHSGNIIVIKTLSGCANAAAETIDSLDFPGILGSIAGDNTVMLVVENPSESSELVRKFEALL